MNFGDRHDFNIAGGTSSRIGAVTIAGQALGTVAGTDHFGIVSRQIGSLNTGPGLFTLITGGANDTSGLAVGLTEDFTAREVGQ